jgi:hypothetical protein
MSQQQHHNNADRAREQHLTEQDGVRLRQSHSRTESCMLGGGEVDAACPCSNDDETEPDTASRRCSSGGDPGVFLAWRWEPWTLRKARGQGAGWERTASRVSTLQPAGRPQIQSHQMHLSMPGHARTWHPVRPFLPSPPLAQPTCIGIVLLCSK